MESQTQSNPSFIDPADHLPYKYGTKEDQENMKLCQRQTAATTHRMDLEKNKDNEILLVSRSDNIIHCMSG